MFADRQHGVDIHRLSCNAILQRHPFQILHRDEGLAAVFADLVDRTNVRVVQGGCGPRLAAEAFERLRVLGKVVGQELEGDEAAKLCVLGLVDDTHPAAPEPLNDAVVGDDLANELGWGGHWREC